VYELYINGVLLKSGDWNASSETIEVRLDGLAVGTHNYSLSLFDDEGNTVSDTVFVVVNDVATATSTTTTATGTTTTSPTAPSILTIISILVTVSRMAVIVVI